MEDGLKDEGFEGPRDGVRGEPVESAERKEFMGTRVLGF